MKCLLNESSTDIPRKPEVVKGARVLAKLDLNRPLSRWYEIAVEEKIERDTERNKKLAKLMNK